MLISTKIQSVLPLIYYINTPKIKKGKYKLQKRKRKHRSVNRQLPEKSSRRKLSRKKTKAHGLVKSHVPDRL